MGNKSNIKQRKLLVLSLIVPIVIQVVKRGGQVSDLSYADSLPVAGTKRSVRDRLGSNVDSSVLHGNKLDNKRCVLLSFFSFCLLIFYFLADYCTVWDFQQAHNSFGHLCIVSPYSCF